MHLTPPICRCPAGAAGLLVMALAGCASVGPDYQPPALNLPAVWQSSPASGVVVGPADRMRWWTQLGDPLLSELIEGALVANPDIAAAQAAVRGARARSRAAEADLAPTTDATGAASRSFPRGQPSSSLYSAELDAGWEIDVFGGVRRGIEAARADTAAAVADLQGVQVTIAAEVALDYISLRTSQRRLVIAQANLASQTETLQLTEWRARAGLASSVELEQARANREQTAAQIPLLQTGRVAAEYALARLLGEAPGAVQARLAASADLPTIPPRIAIGIPADTLRQRPDVRAAEARLMAETARGGVAEANLYPALRLSGSIGVDALTLGGLFGADQVARTLLAGVSGPLFDSGRLRAQVEVQEALQDQTLVAYRATVLDALQEVENALVELDNGRTRVATLERAARAARDGALLAGQRYQGGLIDFQTVLNTERARLALEDSLAIGVSDRLTALIRLYKALGGGWPGDTQQQRSL